MKIVFFRPLLESPQCGQFCSLIWTSKTAFCADDLNKFDDDNDGCNDNYDDNYGNFDDNYGKNY